MTDQVEQVIPTPSPVQRAERNRLVVVETVAFQEAGNPRPVVVDSRWSSELRSEDVPLQRKLVVGGEWGEVAVEPGWLLVLQNQRPFFPSRPPEEVAARAEAAVVEFALSEQVDRPHAILPVGESCRLRPLSPRLWLRCRAGEARVLLTLVPE